jgi:hypothetical protein
MEDIFFFDANCMVGKWGAYNERFPLGLDAIKKVMDKYHIKDALVYSSMSKEYDPMEGNKILLEDIVDEARFQPCWSALPTHSDDIPPLNDFITQMKKGGVRAIRLFPNDSVHRFSLAEWSCGELFDALEEYKVPVLLDFTSLNYEGEDFPADLVYSVCSAHPELPVILLHPGYRTGRVLFSLMDKFDNLRVELSRFMLHRGVEYICKNFGAQRLIFGTKLPYQTPAPIVTMITYANIEDEEKRMIAGENLRILLEGVSW